MKTQVKNSKQLGEIFRKARSQAAYDGKGMSIEKVAAKAGTSSQTVSNLELSRSGVTVSTLFAVAEVVGVTIEVSFVPKTVLGEKVQ